MASEQRHHETISPHADGAGFAAGVAPVAVGGEGSPESDIDPDSIDFVNGQEAVQEDVIEDGDPEADPETDTSPRGKRSGWTGLADRDLNTMRDKVPTKRLGTIWLAWTILVREARYKRSLTIEIGRDNLASLMRCSPPSAEQTLGYLKALGLIRWDKPRRNPITKRYDTRNVTLNPAVNPCTLKPQNIHGSPCIQTGSKDTRETVYTNVDAENIQTLKGLSPTGRERAPLRKNKKGRAAPRSATRTGSRRSCSDQNKIDPANPDPESLREF